MILFFTMLLLFSALAPTLIYGAATQQAAPPSLPAVPTQQLHDIKDVIVLPSPLPWWYWLAGGLTLMAIIGLILFILKKSRRKKQQTIPFHERALHALQSVRNLMTPDQSRAFAIKMAEILRHYIEERFHLYSPDLTTREFLQTLTGETEKISPLLLRHDKLLRNWLNHCDMVKFARYSVTREEMEQMYAEVRAFIESTHPDASGRQEGKKP
jgi:hypothetical protein